MRKVAFVLVAALAMVGAEEVAGQELTASITIGELLSIDVSNTTVGFDTPDFDDFDTGWIVSGDQSVIDTRGNVEHRVTITADGPTMAFLGDDDPSKPAEDLEWDAGSGFVGISETSADVVADLARGANSGAATVSYRMLLDETEDVPGDYSLGFTYTVTAN